MRKQLKLLDRVKVLEKSKLIKKSVRVATRKKILENQSRKLRKKIFQSSNSASSVETLKPRRQKLSIKFNNDRIRLSSSSKEDITGRNIDKTQTIGSTTCSFQSKTLWGNPLDSLFDYEDDIEMARNVCIDENENSISFDSNDFELIESNVNCFRLCPNRVYHVLIQTFISKRKFTCSTPKLEMPSIKNDEFSFLKVSEIS
jgi:hypothetical protein